jgi:hypothetical protein
VFLSAASSNTRGAGAKRKRTTWAQDHADGEERFQSRSLPHSSIPRAILTDRNPLVHSFARARFAYADARKSMVYEGREKLTQPFNVGRGTG